MIMRKRLLILGLMAVLVVAGSAPSFAARAISGAVGNVDASDGALLNNLCGFRTYSALPGGESNINDNTSSCRNIRCLRPYSTNPTLQPGGFVANQEATQVYNGDVPDQPYYQLADCCLNDTAANHVGFYAVGGVTANNSGIGNHLAAGCPSTTATNCFTRNDTSVAGPLLLHARNGFPAGGNSLRAVGGLNPIPNVLVKVGNGCPAGSACLTWPDPPDYAAQMHPSNDAPAPPSPVLGVTLYRNDGPSVGGVCTEPTGAGPWDPIGTFPLGAGAVGTVVPLPCNQANPQCSWFALRVRVIGPGGLPNSIETACVGVNSQPVTGCATAVRIARFNATYAGHGVVNVAWTSGIEGDVSGYYVTRGASAAGPFTRVSGLVPATGDGSHYSRADQVGSNTGRVLYYQLQVVGRDGTTTPSSSVEVTVQGRSKKRAPAVR